MKMEAKGFIKVVIVCTLLCSITPLYAAIPWLYVDGNDIKDPAGNVVVLRGVAMIDLGETQFDRGGAKAMVDRVTNKNDPCGSSPGWYPNVIRVAVYPSDEPSFSSPFPWSYAGRDLYYNNLLRPVVDYCAQKGVYVIIDWHYVGREGVSTYDKATQTSTFWTDIAPRFANDSHVLFELFNEPYNLAGADDAARWESCRVNMQAWTNIVRASASDNLILVAGPQWSQIIAPCASNPVTGGNIVYVSHIYPLHWLTANAYHTNQIKTCVAAHPVMMTEWGFFHPADIPLHDGTITNYGQPLMNFREEQGIGNTAWCADWDWKPPMFKSYPLWGLRIGEGEMGGFTKDKLYEKRNDDQPSYGSVDFIDYADFAVEWGRTDCGPAGAWCNGADFNHDKFVRVDDLEQFVSSWLDE